MQDVFGLRQLEKIEKMVSNMKSCTSSCASIILTSSEKYSSQVFLQRVTNSIRIFLSVFLRPG